ncbi:helix-turn-helix and ligand-binding sensor domain-containing protein [Mariniphaga sediminis]|uniref:helix-turn-helix and ligand-binding sensor domain-containing protein n=1 Tax=Mariniphaga sediminis TaxID=1628158 RepID=UPI00356A85FF
MSRYRLISILLGICQIYTLRGAVVKDNIKNFSKKEYHAANQNWSMDASPNGFMYFANHSGLLEFDGTSWTLHRLPNQTILRSVRVVSDSLIFTGGYRELGFWKTGKDGKLLYHSLNGLTGKNLDNNDEFWNISVLNDTVYFHSFSKILVYRNNTISKIELPGFTNTMNRVGQNILIAVNGKGIYAIENNKAKPLITDPRLENVTFRFILPYKINQILIGTSTQGIFLWDGNQLSEWNPLWTNYFRNNEVNRAYVNEKGHLSIGTIIDGVTVFNQNEHKIASYNTSSGLQNNTVHGIATDAYGNTWLALDSGIDFISDDFNPEIKIETIPGIGSIYDVAVFENKIYLGTNRGLFFKNLGNEDEKYRLIPETSIQVWDCQVLDGQLFVGFNQGMLGIKNGDVKLVSKQAGGFSIRKDPLRPGRLIESTYSNLVILEKKDSVYRQTGTIKGFFDLIRYIEFDHLGNLWASHMHRGVYKIQLNSKRDSVTDTKYYGTQSAFGKDHSIHVFKVENRIVFTTKNQLFTYNDLNDSIVPYTFLNENLGHFATAHRIVAAPDHHYWFITQKKIGLFRLKDNGVQLIKSIPLQVFTPHEPIDDFENISPLTSTEAIICLENGLAWFDAAKTDTLAEIESYIPGLREISLTDNQGTQRKGTLEEGKLQVKFRFHNVRLRYAFPHYTHRPIYFQALLKGIDPDWSEKKAMPVFNFDRLPPGEYELHVKAVDTWENESKKQSITIEILPPWYLTNYARSGYVLALLLLIFGLQLWGIKRTQKKERRQLEKREQELIKLRNEKLRNEVEYKSKELANSTMGIIKKNEFLLKLKHILSNQREQLGSRYPDKYYLHIVRKIDENISSKDDWRLFETNFEQAHEQFLHKMKEQHPNLTPKDLRLCAFLRMNLTSKEIAPLLGISVRGVENHRYRLRKKMGLEHDDNLIEMILKL